MTSTWNGLPFGMAAEQPPKAPLAHPPRTLEAHKAPLSNVPLIPTTAGPLAQQLPRALFPKGTREARLTNLLKSIYAYAHAADPVCSFRRNSLRHQTLETPLCHFYKVPIPWTQRHPRDTTPTPTPRGTQGDPKGPGGKREGTEVPETP